MKKKEFEVFEKKLLDKGYRKWDNQFDYSDYNLYKPFHYDNEFEEGRSGYQLFFKIYDYTIKDWPNLPEDMKGRVGLEVAVEVSRTIDERMDFSTSFNDKNDTIESIEELAEAFYKWVETVYPEPRKY